MPSDPPVGSPPPTRRVAKLIPAAILASGLGSAHSGVHAGRPFVQSPTPAPPPFGDSYIMGAVAWVWPHTQRLHSLSSLCSLHSHKPSDTLGSLARDFTFRSISCEHRSSSPPRIQPTIWVQRACRHGDTHWTTARICTERRTWRAWMR